jgi:polysaccharide export outer membrane protein
VNAEVIMKLHRRKTIGELSAVSTLLAGLLAILFAGCVAVPEQPKGPPLATLAPTPVTPDSSANLFDQSLLQKPNTPFTLGPGDKVDIELLGDPATHTTTTVGPDGKIYFYLLPGLDVWGMTLPQARETITKELQKYMRESQSVAISLHSVESKRVWLLGRLNNPGVYPLSGPTTLLEAIAQAGGPATTSALASFASATRGTATTVAPDAADLRRGFIIRQGKMLPVDFNRLLREGDLYQNIYLQPDDFVYLPSAGAQEVHVLGAVAGAKAVPFDGQLSLVQTIAEAGGTIKDAYTSHVAIVRGSLTTPKIAIVDYGAIIHGEAPDVLLEPQDIVYVPFTPYRTLSRYVDLILTTFARTVGVNEGARAVNNDALPARLNVGIGP